MCGLVAGYGDVALATAGLAHRGVRSSVADLARGASVGHARLPIVGVGPEHDQPMQRGPWTVAFVGEILNFRELYPGAECDAEVVADEWEKNQWRGFAKFDGFWTVAAAHEDGAVYVLTDYLAQKPAYYRSDRYATAVASEPDAVAAMGPVTPDELYFADVVKWGYCPDHHRTPYREVRRTGPGEVVIIRGPYGRAVVEVVDPLVPIYDATPEGLRRVIETAARRRAISSDVPVAALVSGGLDSAIAYTLASRYADVVPYHVDNDEFDWARQVVGPAKINLTAPASVQLGEALAYMQEPLDLGSLFPQVALSKVVQESVCLTGDGADEFFGGYDRARRYDSQASDVWRELVCYHLPRLDRVMMRNRVEVRSPFLARRVAEVALGLPRELRTDKRVLRDLFRGDLPHGVADRPKVALRTPEVAADREWQSRRLVEAFRRSAWPGEVARAAE